MDKEAIHEEALALLRSAYQIAQRRGENVDWERFATSVLKLFSRTDTPNPVTARWYKAYNDS